MQYDSIKNICNIPIFGCCRSTVNDSTESSSEISAHRLTHLFTLLLVGFLSFATLLRSPLIRKSMVTVRKRKVGRNSFSSHLRRREALQLTRHAAGRRITFCHLLFTKLSYNEKSCENYFKNFVCSVSKFGRETGEEGGPNEVLNKLFFS